MTTPQQCQTFRWCILPAGHDVDDPGRSATAHVRDVLTVYSRAGGIKVDVRLKGDAEREVVDLIIGYEWADVYEGPLFEVSPDVAEALGTVILTLDPDSLACFGEVLLTGGRTLLATLTEGSGDLS